MLTIPLYFFLIIYGLFLLAVTGFFIMNIKNLVRTGTFALTAWLATFFFLGLSLFVINLTGLALQAVDWQQPLTVWNGTWNSPSSPLNQTQPI